MAAIKLPLYGSNTTLGWSVVRWISMERGEQLATKGRLRRVVDDYGQHAGYQLIDETRVDDSFLPSLASSASLTARESEANAGLCGVSATVHLTEFKRTHRLHSQTGKILPAEDFIERAQAKVEAFCSTANLANGDRAVRIYPRAQ